jgi:hypothetical protein
MTPQEEEEDSAIQDLLDDIRGSFERQFDDEFNDLTNAKPSSASNNSDHDQEDRGSSPFANINIGSAFSMSDGNGVQLEDLEATAEDLLSAVGDGSSPDEMPLEGWSMPQEVFDNFLEAAATTANEDNQFHFHPQDHPSTSNHRY